jgi:hypothetical protein
MVAVQVMSASSEFLRDAFLIIVMPLFHIILGCLVLLLGLGCFFSVIAMNKMKADKTLW